MSKENIYGIVSPIGDQATNAADDILRQEAGQFDRINSDEDSQIKVNIDLNRAMIPLIDACKNRNLDAVQKAIQYT